MSFFFLAPLDSDRLFYWPPLSFFWEIRIGHVFCVGISLSEPLKRWFSCGFPLNQDETQPHTHTKSPKPEPQGEIWANGKQRFPCFLQLMPEETRPSRSEAMEWLEQNLSANARSSRVREGVPAACVRGGLVPQLGTLSHPFFGWEGSPTKIDILKTVGTLILASPLEDLREGDTPKMSV